MIWWIVLDNVWKDHLCRLFWIKILRLCLKSSVRNIGAPELLCPTCFFGLFSLLPSCLCWQCFNKIRKYQWHIKKFRNKEKTKILIMAFEIKTNKLLYSWGAPDFWCLGTKTLMPLQEYKLFVLISRTSIRNLIFSLYYWTMDDSARTLVPQMFLTDHPLDRGGGHFCSIWFEKIMVGDRH